MITSNRQFGIEIEFITDSAQSLINIMNKDVRLVEDGSLRPYKFAREYVSSPLSGKSGEAEIRRVCEILKKYGATCDNPKTSMHVHLDGRKFSDGVLKSSVKKPDQIDGIRMVAVSGKLKRLIGTKGIVSLLRRDFYAPELNVYTARFGHIIYHSLGKLSKEPSGAGYTYCYFERVSRLEWLRNVLYFYTKFSDTMEVIVSNSRRFGNMYCIPLGMSYELGDIAKVKNMDELCSLWYKGRNRGGHYDDSRYHNVNLHSYWDRHGTVEIRSHGGTIDADKVLMWVKLHQKIVDKLEDTQLETLIDLEPTHASFLEFIEEPILQEYVKRLAGYYSGINI